MASSLLAVLKLFFPNNHEVFPSMVAFGDRFLSIWPVVFTICILQVTKTWWVQSRSPSERQQLGVFHGENRGLVAASGITTLKVSRINRKFLQTRKGIAWIWRCPMFLDLVWLDQICVDCFIYRNVCNFPASKPCLQYKQGKGNMWLFQLCRNGKSILNRAVDWYHTDKYAIVGLKVLGQFTLFCLDSSIVSSELLLFFQKTQCLYWGYKTPCAVW